MNEIVFKSVVWKKGDESFRKMPSWVWVWDRTQVLSHRSFLLLTFYIHSTFLCQKYCQQYAIFWTFCVTIFQILYKTRFGIFYKTILGLGGNKSNFKRSKQKVKTILIKRSKLFQNCFKIWILTSKLKFFERSKEFQNCS